MEAAERQGEPTRLGSYEIVRKLARGGMAELYLAKTVINSFERLVVLKQILPRYGNHPRYVQLFLDEAKLAASLNHKNIVQVFDIGNDDGRYFFAMEYLHGQDVRTLLHREWQTRDRMPFAHAVQIAGQIASALHYAHDKRRPDGSLLDLVHRDVSPSNIVVTYAGDVKLLDFGVAKAATSTIKTRTGTLKGKIAYMSPEQAKGASVDRRSDIFSLGIVLWEMVTTKRLFKGDNDLATLQLIINVPPRRPSELNPEVPPELDRIILRALAQDVTQRYQTAQELADDLEALVREGQLVQSASALSTYMGELFREEIISWQTAQAQGVELSEHLTSVGDMTTPVSSSDFIEEMSFAAMAAADEELALDDEELDEDLEPVAGQIDAVPDPARARPSAAQIDSQPVRTSLPALPRTRTDPGAPGPAVIVRVDPTPLPVPPPYVPPPPPHVPTPPAGLPRMTPQAGLHRQSWPQPMQTIAPGGEVFTPEQAARWYRIAGYVGAVVLVVIVVIAIAGGR